MDKYYVNKNTRNPGGNHEVHKYSCSWLPEPHNREYLGEFANCHGAVKEAKNRGYSNVDGCIHCSPACHSE